MSNKPNISIGNFVDGAIKGNVEFKSKNKAEEATDAHNYNIGGRVSGEVAANAKLTFDEDNNAT